MQLSSSGKRLHLSGMMSRSTSRLTDFLQTYAAVLVQAGYHVSVMEGLTVLYPPAQCIQKIADVFLGKVQHHLEVQVVVFLHSIYEIAMRVRIAKIWIWPGIVKNIVYDPVHICIHTEPPLVYELYGQAVQLQHEQCGMVFDERNQITHQFGFIQGEQRDAVLYLRQAADSLIAHRLGGGVA